MKDKTRHLGNGEMYLTPDQNGALADILTTYWNRSIPVEKVQRDIAAALQTLSGWTRLPSPTPCAAAPGFFASFTPPAAWLVPYAALAAAGRHRAAGRLPGLRCCGRCVVSFTAFADLSRWPTSWASRSTNACSATSAGCTRCRTSRSTACCSSVACLVIGYAAGHLHGPARCAREGALRTVFLYPYAMSFVCHRPRVAVDAEPR